MRPNVLSLAASLLIGMLALGCDAYRQGPANSNDNLAGRNTSQITIEPVDRAGFDRVIAEHAGEVVLVDFWATTCPPCRTLFPHTVSLYRQLHSQGFAVVSMSLDQLSDKQRAREFLSQNGATFDNLISNYPDVEDVVEAFGIPDAIPYFTLYDRQGKLRFRFSPLFEDGKEGEPLDNLEPRIRELLAEK